ncbi:TPA: hypothetical protein ACJG4D_004474, partial [Salmonella enterica subsp. enterica serovar Mississippi]
SKLNKLTKKEFKNQLVTKRKKQIKRIIKPQKTASEDNTMITPISILISNFFFFKTGAYDWTTTSLTTA